MRREIVPSTALSLPQTYQTNTVEMVGAVELAKINVNRLVERAKQTMIVLDPDTVNVEWVCRTSAMGWQFSDPVLYEQNVNQVFSVHQVGYGPLVIVQHDEGEDHLGRWTD